MKFFLLLIIVGCAAALPRSYYRRYAESARLQAAYARPRRAPVHRTMLISGYYRPVYAQRRTGLEPETAMTAFATGDSVAAGSYLGSKGGSNCLTCGTEQDNTEFVQSPELPVSELDQAEGPVEDLPEGPEPLTPLNDEEEVAVAPPKPARTPKRKPSKKIVKKPEEDTEGDDVGEEDNFQNPTPYNSYFPILFRGYPGGRSGSGGSGSGGGVTAIANSYSTGKGGVATSHATAYGGAPPSRPKKRTEEADEE